MTDFGGLFAFFATIAFLVWTIVATINFFIFEGIDPIIWDCTKTELTTGEFPREEVCRQWTFVGYKNSNH